MKKTQSVAILGTGPAGLMAAHRVALAGYKVHLFEKRPSAGRKILIAGSSGLNISFHAPLQNFMSQYSGPRHLWEKILSSLPPEAWRQFVQSLGLETFLGTSGRYFVRGMKGASLLKNWVDQLKQLGVEFHFQHEVTDFDHQGGEIWLKFGDQAERFSAACFCLGGGSWEKTEKPLRWPKIFLSKMIQFREFSSANSGFKVNWSEAFLKEAEGLPLKSVLFSTTKGSRAGELMITQYGLEGTPIYALGEVGQAWIDLKPAWSEREMLTKLNASKENLSPMRRVKKFLGLSPAALALVFHLTPQAERDDLKKLTARIKKFPIFLQERQPLEEAISSSGGLAWNEVNDSLMLKKFPGVFVAGEMLDWEAPTGGYLIQGCVSQGYYAGESLVNWLQCD